MNQFLFSICSALLLFTQEAAAQQDNFSNVHIGFVYPLSTNGKYAKAYTNEFSFHLLHGISRAEKGFCFASVANQVTTDVDGFLFSGVAHYVGGNARGMQFAGVANIIGGTTEGIQFAGLINKAKSLRGMQFAGFANLITDTADGVQAAGFCSVADHAGNQFSGFCNIARSIDGVQFAGFNNISRRTNGVQAAGFSNTAQELEGTQLAGFINVAKDVTGTQVAGFINVARKVKGVQIAGFINIADSSEYPIGIINIIKHGERSAGISIDETGSNTAAFRSGSKKTYGILGISYNSTHNQLRYGLEAGIGTRYAIGIGCRLNAEVVVHTNTDFEHGACIRSSARVFPSVCLARRIEVFAGPSFSYSSYTNYDGKGFDVHYLWSKRSDHYFQGMNIGLIAGVQVQL